MLIEGARLYDRLNRTSFAPGYRDATLIIDVDRGTRIEKIELNFRKEDALAIAEFILEMHDLAWNREAPIDAEPGETKPSWVVPHGERREMCPASWHLRRSLGDAT